jgi:hypothetical protein
MKNEKSIARRNSASRRVHAEFYAEAAYPLTHRRAAKGFAALLADNQLGHVWFIQGVPNRLF